jgi:hypothetical protein
MLYEFERQLYAVNLGISLSREAKQSLPAFGS